MISRKRKMFNSCIKLNLFWLCHKEPFHHWVSVSTYIIPFPIEINVWVSFLYEIEKPQYVIAKIITSIIITWVDYMISTWIKYFGNKFQKTLIFWVSFLVSNEVFLQERQLSTTFLHFTFYCLTYWYEYLLEISIRNRHQILLLVSSEFKQIN